MIVHGETISNISLEIFEGMTVFKRNGKHKEE